MECGHADSWAHCHEPTHAPQRSFDHLVGAGEQRRRNVEAKRLGGLEVNSNVRTSLVAALEVQQDLPL